MILSEIFRHPAQLRHRNLILMGVFVTLTILLPFIAYKITVYSSEQTEERAAQAKREERERKEEKSARRIYAVLTHPRSGTTPERIAAVSIGMMGEEVQKILDYPHTLGMEIFPYAYSYDEFEWVSHDIPIKGVGWVQAVFIDRQLVGLGSLDPKDGRVCGGCLEDMLRGERPWLAGLPYHVEEECPVCGSDKVVPYGVRWSQYNLQDNLCCGIERHLYERSGLMYFWEPPL